MSAPAESADSVVIAGRYRGPPGSGNGGYTCGLLAAGMPMPVEVTLKQPPPLDRPLKVLQIGEARVLMDDGEHIAEARRSTLDLLPPPCPGLGAATEAAARYRGLEEHAFPGCFVCGTNRAPGDGLRVFAGEVSGGMGGKETYEGLVACPWKPSAELAGPDGRVRPEFTWAALDCPGAWAWLHELENPLVLGRLTVAASAPVMAGRPHIVGGWRLGREGRKHYSGTVIWRADGTPCVRARATWIEIDAARFAAAG